MTEPRIIIPTTFETEQKEGAGIFPKYQPRYAEQNVITFPVGPDKKPAIKHWQKLGPKGSAQLADKFSDFDTFGFPLARVRVSPSSTWIPRTRACCTKRRHATARPPTLWRRAAVITPTTDTAASAGISGRGGRTPPLMSSAAVMPLVPPRWRPRGHTKSFTAPSMTLRTSRRFTSCLTSYGGQSRGEAQSITVSHEP